MNFSNTLPELFLQAYQPVNEEKTCFRINATHAAHVSPTEKDIAAMFAASVSNNLAIVSNSIDYVVSNERIKILSFLAQGNVISKPLEENNDRIICVSANVFLDKDDETYWRMQGDGSERRLVQATQENYDDLLHSRLARRNGTMVTASNYTPFHHGIKPQVMDWAMYYSAADSKVRFGFGLPVGNGQVLLASLDGKTEKVSSLAIIDTANLATQPEGAVPNKILAHMKQALNILAGADSLFNDEAVLDPNTDDFTEPMAKNFLTYMSSLYKGTDFFRTLSDLVARRRQISLENSPLTTMRLV